MSRWVVVPAMHLKPYRCIACGSTPRDTTHPNRPQLQAYFCEGVDVNFGDSVFLCEECVKVLGQLRGMVDVDVHEKLMRQHKELEVSYRDLEADYNTQESRIERMLDGVKAKKEVTSSRKKTKVATNA
jgi:aminoglycoside N3'-acetyltransferase